MDAVKVIDALDQYPGGLGLMALRRASGLRNQTFGYALNLLLDRGLVMKKTKLGLAEDEKRRELVRYSRASGHRGLNHERCQPNSRGRLIPGPLSVLRYPGGKYKLIKHIAPLLAPSLATAKVFAEPFVGGGSVALWVAANYPRVRLVLNDLDPAIAALWRTLTDTEGHQALAEKIRRRRPTRRFFNELGRGEPNLDLPAAFQCLMINRLSHGGRRESGFSQDHCDRFDGAEFARRIRRIHRLLVGRTEVRCEDALGLIRTLPNRAVVYADPPYPTAGRQLYRYWMDDYEHEALATALIKRGEPWIVSQESGSDVRELYAGCRIERIPNRGKTEYLILSRGLERSAPSESRRNNDRE
ncbi:MAG: DNA adenine methylase [Elusimicrobiota bacterium]